MLHYLDIEETEVPKMCLELYREHGTTMAGLKVNYIYTTYINYISYYLGSKMINVPSTAIFSNAF